jgi:hypothetical protein
MLEHHVVSEDGKRGASAVSGALRERRYGPLYQIIPGFCNSTLPDAVPGEHYKNLQPVKSVAHRVSYYA